MTASISSSDGPPGDPLISVVVVARDRAELVGECVDSLLRQTESRLEIIAVLNGATEELRRALADRAALDPRLHLLPIEPTTASRARNLGVLKSRGPIAYFVDDDTEIPENVVARYIALFEARPTVGIAGGPNLTHPHDPPFAQVTGALLASVMGTGVTRLRYKMGRERAGSERHLILCNLAMRRHLFDSGLRFPIAFGGEENVVMGRAHAAGHAMWYSPALAVYHHRRRTFGGFAEQMHRYGRGRANALRMAPKTFHPAFFAPVALMVYLAALPLLLVSSMWFIAPVVLYAFGCAVSALAVTRRVELLPSWPAAIALYPVMHLTYASGLVLGLLRRRARGADHHAATKRSPTQ